VLRVKCNEHAGMLNLERKFYLVKNQTKHNPALHTFALYLFHMPMLYFISAIFPYESNYFVNLICCWLVVPTAIILLSCYTENKKYKYKIFFERILEKFNLSRSEREPR
jgi:hypothetical protein